MNTFRRIGALLVVCTVLLTAVSGCQTSPTVAPATEDNPGAWAEVMPKTPAVTFDGLKVTIKADYRARTTDYIDRIKLEDDQKQLVGELAFEFGKDVDVTFALPGGTQSVVIILNSTKRGLWRSNPISVPAPKK